MTEHIWYAANIGFLLCRLDEYILVICSFISFSPGWTFSTQLLYISSSAVRCCTFVPGWTEHGIPAQQKAVNVSGQAIT
ncbi:MAG: hypothetical protein LC117_09610 [Bacteroidia bacterium]|nr:hypothetical protein [Bacteroidia bacterium]